MHCIRMSAKNFILFQCVCLKICLYNTCCNLQNGSNVKTWSHWSSCFFYFPSYDLKLSLINTVVLLPANHISVHSLLKNISVSSIFLELFLNCFSPISDMLYAQQHGIIFDAFRINEQHLQALRDSLSRIGELWKCFLCVMCLAWVRKKH